MATLQCYCDGDLDAMKEWLDDKDKECPCYVMAAAQPMVKGDEHGNKWGDFLQVDLELAGNDGKFCESEDVDDLESAAKVIGAVNKIKQALDLIEDSVKNWVGLHKGIWDEQATLELDKDQLDAVKFAVESSLSKP